MGFCSTMAKSIQVKLINKLVRNKVMGSKCGPMVPNMKDSGTKIKLKDLEGSFSQTVMYIKETGLMIKLTVMVSISMPKAQPIKDLGSKTNKKAVEKNNGQMDHFMKGSIFVEKSMAEAYFNGLMVPNTKENGKTTKCTAKVNSNGLTEECTKATI